MVSYSNIKYVYYEYRFFADFNTKFKENYKHCINFGK